MQNKRKTMEEFEYQDIEYQLKTNKLRYYNLYNLDIAPEQYFAVQYYKEHQYDSLEVNQKITISYADIECYTNHSEFGDIKEAKNPINAISEINNITEILTGFFLVHEKNLEHFYLNKNGDNIEQVKSILQDYYKKELLKVKAIPENYKVKVNLFFDELELIKSYFAHVHELDPFMLGGFNSDYFDYPYIWYRLIKLLNGKVQDAAAIMSKFNQVNVHQGYINIPEFVFYDVLYFFKPRDEGGLNYGKKQPMYTLDWLGETYLNINKLSYKEENMSLDMFYEQDPVNFFLYNLLDICITKQLADKFDHYNTHNNIRRLARNPYSYSIKGTSLIYDTFILYEQSTKDKYIRAYISSEKSKSIKVDKLAKIPTPVIKGKRISPVEIKDRDFREISTRYSGAYVKSPRSTIITSGLTIDLDASSLYPSMMVQSNISFDTFRKYIINPPVYPLLNGLANLCGTNQPIPQILTQKVAEMVNSHINSESYQNKSTAFKHYYYAILYLYYHIVNSKIPFDRICNPTNDHEAIILKMYLIPLLDIVNIIHNASNKEYNQFAYDYLFMPEEALKNKYDHIYVINDIFDTSCSISKLSIDKAVEMIQNYSLTIAGTLFDKHEAKQGLFYNIIQNLWALRKEAKQMRDKYKVGTEEYNLYDKLQVTYKVATNSLYGVFGLSTFRFSHFLIAQSITAQGRLINKVAQYISEKTLSLAYGEFPK